MNSSTNPTKAIFLTAVITMAVTSLVWIGVGATAYWFTYRQAPSFELTLDYPETVEVGEVFKIRVAVKNGGTRNLSLANLDLYEDLYNGFEIVDVVPKPRSTDRLFGYVSYNFNRKLKPAETFEIELELRGKDAGLWGGDIDACNVMQNFVTHYTEIEVVESAKIESGD